MVIEIKVPNVGESVQEAMLTEWFAAEGAAVEKDSPLFVIETDKVTLEVVAEASGTLHIQVAEGETVAIGAVVGTIDTEGAQEAPAPEKKAPPTPAEPAPAPVEPAPAVALDNDLAPSVRRLVAERGIDPAQIPATGPDGRLTKGDVLLYIEQGGAPPLPAVPATETAPPASQSEVVRKPMTPIRARIAERLLQAKQNTAMLTTFNEIDMSAVMALRSRFKNDFKETHDVSLGFMSFFTKACVAALKAFPEINASIDGKQIVYNRGQHIGIAVGSERGLVVPVIRDCQRLRLDEIEKAIIDYVVKIKAGKLALADMEGGTFTITNGGVFGSLMSTPILNVPQSGILGMHKIEKRPVVVDDQIVIRPMMYVALSYDHRIVDGQGAVSFLVKVKACIEQPERLLLEI